MTSRLFAMPMAASIFLHTAGLIVASRLTGLEAQTAPMDLIPIEVVTAESQPAALAVHPKPEPPKPQAVRKITPPRLIEKTPIATPVAPLPTEAPLPQQELPTPLEAEEPRPGPPIPTSPNPLDDIPGNVMGPPVLAGQGSPAAAVEGSEAGAGKLFPKGDVAVVPGSGTGGGSGGTGNSGLGLGATGDGTKVSGLRLGVARPLGGYQVKPRYPESARRKKAQGTSLLRLLVLDNGTVGEILVEQSAGHPDLDSAAVEAVKKWRFEPARDDGRPIAIWVRLPVRFELR